MSSINVLILGIIEGITEFLPISSTGHLILASRLLAIPQSEFIKSFEIAIQLGAIAAVIVLYGRSLLIKKEVMQKVLTAFIPTGIIGLALYKIIKTYLLGNDSVVVLSLFIGGIFILVFEKMHKEKENATGSIDEISYSQAFLIGIFQSIAIIPGVSRSAATIIGGLFLNLKRKIIIEFSFLLAIPTMAAATGLDLIKNSHTFTSQEFGALALGFFISFFVALYAIKFLLEFIKSHSFSFFGIYRIIIAVLFWIFFI